MIIFSCLSSGNVHIETNKCFHLSYSVTKKILVSFYVVHDFDFNQTSRHWKNALMSASKNSMKLVGSSRVKLQCGFALSLHQHVFQTIITSHSSR